MVFVCCCTILILFGLHGVLEDTYLTVPTQRHQQTILGTVGQVAYLLGEVPNVVQSESREDVHNTMRN